MKPYVPIGIPIVFSIASFVLTLLALFAGSRPGFLEDYHIVMRPHCDLAMYTDKGRPGWPYFKLNTTELGKNLIPTATSDGGKPSSTSDACSGLPGELGRLCGSATSAVSSLASQAAQALDGVEDDVADKLAHKLGIRQFYSLHVMNACEGDFSPNATASHAHYNVTHCSKLMKTAQYNVSAQLDHELRVGPLHLDLADLGFTDDIQKQLNKIPKLLRAFAVLYLLATALTGISMLTSAAALMTVPQQPRRRSGYRQRRQPGLSARAVTIANLVVACLAATVLLIADATATAAGHEAAKEVNKHGTRVGLRAHVGKQFLIMVWVAFGTAVVTVGYWSWAVWKGKRSGWDGAGSGGGLKKSVSRRSDDSFAPPPPMRSV